MKYPHLHVSKLCTIFCSDIELGTRSFSAAPTRCDCWYSCYGLYEIAVLHPARIVIRMSNMNQAPTIKLSICLPTFNRADFLGETLESLVDQVTDECEIVVSDNASSDGTAELVGQYASRFERLRYVRQEANIGLDRNYDSAVETSQGEYCWLFSDDDLLKPGAVRAVLDALHSDYSLVMVNYERRDRDLSSVVMASYVEGASNRHYGPQELDRLLEEAGGLLIYIGSVIIKREIWREREKQPYYGSMFIHLGVIFQEPLPGEALLISEPLIIYRDGNSRTRYFEVLMIRWPLLIWSLAPSESAKRKLCNKEPWRNLRQLLLFRGGGCYSLMEYRQWIRPRLSTLRQRLLFIAVALIPGVIANAICMAYYSAGRSRFSTTIQYFLRGSPFHMNNWLPKRQVFRVDRAQRTKAPQY